MRLRRLTIKKWITTPSITAQENNRDISKTDKFRLIVAAADSNANGNYKKTTSRSNWRQRKLLTAVLKKN